MNANRIIDMIVRQVMRRIVNKGVNKGFDMAGRMGGSSRQNLPDPVEKRQQNSSNPSQDVK